MELRRTLVRRSCRAENGGGPPGFTAYVLLLGLMVRPGLAEDLGDAQREYYSPALGQSLRVLEGVLSPIEAEKQVLPYMKANEHLFRDSAVLDVGTGSGIIALYAARLGARQVVATDISTTALACTKMNAKRLGSDAIVETRWVPPSDITAYSVIRPQETFDVIVSNPPYTFDLDARSNSAMIDRGDLGFSLIRGLEHHLKPGGVAILLYATFFSHEVIVKFARHLGYEVEHFSPDYSTPWEQDVLYNSYLERILEREGLAPDAFEFDWLQDQRNQIGDLFRLYPTVEIPRQGDLYSGLIVVKNHPPEQ
jgi:predicted RNA methylase